jgi:hypothetical protein
VRLQLSPNAIGIILALILVAGISFGLGFQFHPNISGVTATVTKSSMVAEPNCTYDILLENGYYAAQNCKTQAIVYGGDSNLGYAIGINASAVIQSAINSLRGICGTILLGPYNYQISKGLITFPCIAIIGPAPTGDFATNPNSAVLNITDDLDPGITVEVDPTHAGITAFPYLADFTLYGSHATGYGTSNQDGIYITDSYGVINDIFVSHVLIFNMGGTGFHINNAGKAYISYSYSELNHGNGLLVTTGFLTQIDHCYIFGNLENGINATSTKFYVGTFDIESNEIWDNSRYGIYIYPDITEANYPQSVIQILDNRIKDNGALPGYSNINLSNVRDFTISGNSMGDDRTPIITDHDVSFGARTSGEVIDNLFYTSTESSIFDFNSINNNITISNNDGFDPVGLISTPFYTAEIAGSIGLQGTTSGPVNNTIYNVTSVSQYIVSTGGSNVNITIYYPNSAIPFETDLSTYGNLLAVGYRIQWSFTTPPVVKDSGN